MSIAHIVTRGYGNGTFAGTIADIALRGYSIGEAAEVVETAVTGGWLSAEQVAKLRQIASDADRDRANESRRRKQRAERRLGELEGMFDAIQGIIPEAAVENVAEAVRPFSAPSDTRVPPTEAIDFPALLASTEAVRALTQALLEASAIRQEEDALALLMMSA